MSEPTEQTGPVEPLPEAPVVPTSRLWLAGAIAVVLLAGLFVLGWLPKHRQAQEAEEAARPSVPRVLVAKPKVAKTTGPLALPATIGALRETQIFARASGYVRRWLVDIGDQVSEGQLLAELDTPELDQELAQAKAMMAQHKVAIDQAVANANFARSERNRYEGLAPKGVVSQQDLDTQRTRAEVAEAGVEAAKAQAAGDEANVRRLNELKAFSHVTAPFAGTITARAVENGTLVTAGTGGGRGLFTLVSSDPVRVWLDVPQEAAVAMQPGLDAGVTVREYPGKLFEGHVSRTAGALDTNTRTLRTEVLVPNPEHQLLVGMYAEVTLDVNQPRQALIVPATALLLTSKGTQLAVVDAEDRVKRVNVRVERDTGPELVVYGLNGDERVIINPGTDTLDGVKVAPVDQQAQVQPPR